MAFNQQLLMHNMTVKGKRLTAGLELLVKAFEEGVYVKGFAYHYALGCLGGDSITKKLMKTKWLPDVVDALVANNLMKPEKGEKLKAEWKENFVPVEEEKKTGVENRGTAEDSSPVSCLASSSKETRTDGDEVGVKSETHSTDTHPSSDLTPAAPPYRPHNETASDEGNSGSDSKDWEKPAQTGQKTPSESDDAKDEQTVAPTVQTTPEAADAQISRISFLYDTKTKVCDYKETVPKSMLGLFYDICDSRSVTGYFPHTIEHRGETWTRCEGKTFKGTNQIEVVYEHCRE